MATTILTGTKVSASLASSSSLGRTLITNPHSTTTSQFDEYGLTITSNQGWYPLTVTSPYETAARFKSTDGTAAIEIGDNSSTNDYNKIVVVGNSSMKFYTNNAEKLTLTDAGVIVNDASYSSFDFRVEGNDETHTFFSDSGANKVTIGTSVVGDEKFKVAGNVGITGSLHVSGNITTSGSIIAREFRTEFVSQVIATSSGSTTFGDDNTDTHRFTGSLNITGSNVLLANNTFYSAEDADGDDINLLGIHSNNNCYIGPSTNAWAGGAMLYGAASNTNAHVWYEGDAERMRISDDGYLGIGTNAPTSLLHIFKGDGSIPDDSNNFLLLEDNLHCYMGIGGGTSSDTGIHFMDSGGIRGRVAYHHATDSMTFKTANTVQWTLDSSGNVAQTGDLSGSLGSTGSFDKITANQIGLGSNTAEMWSSTELDLGTSGNMRVGGTIYFYDSNRYIQRNGNNLDYKVYGAAGTATATHNFISGNVSASLASTGSFGILSVNDVKSTPFVLGNVSNKPRITYTGDFFQFTDADNSYASIYVDSASIYSDLDLVRDKSLSIGVGSDLVLKHDGSNTYIYNETGDFQIYNKANDKDLILSSDDGSGGTTAYITLDGSTVRTEFDKIADFNAGAFFPDDSIAYFGAGNDLRIWHDGSNSIMYAYGTGHLYIGTTVDDANVILVGDNGSGGTADYLVIDGGAVAIDLLQDTRLKATKKLYLDGGGNSYITETSADIVDFYAGGVHMISLDEVNDEVVFNEGSVDIDFRVESNGKTSAIKVDAGADRVDIGASMKAEYGLRVDGLSRTGGNAASHHFTTWNNIMTFSDNTNQSGSFCINTDIGRASSRMCSIHVTGYAYGGGEIIDFTISFYTYGGAAGQDSVNGYPFNPIIVDRGTDGHDKYVGINADGNIAIAIDNPDSGNKYYYGFKCTLDNHLNSTGHSAYNSWSSSYSEVNQNGWLDYRIPVPTMKMNQRNFGIGMMTSSIDYRLVVSENGGSTDDHFIVNPANGHNRTMEIAGDAINVTTTGGGSNTLKLQEDGGDVQMLAAAKLNLSTGGDTYIYESAGDILNFYTGGENMLELSSAGSDPRISYFNKDNRDRDFSFCGDTNDNAFYFDASLESVGFGTTTPSQRIDLGAGRIIMNNNYGYVQRDVAGNSATVLNQGGSDILYVGDVNHTEQVKIRTANHTGNGGLHLASDGTVSISGNLGLSSPMSCNYGAIFNEGSNDSDTRIESNDNTHMFLVDAGANRIGINVSAPAKDLHIFQTEGVVGAKHATIRLGGYSTVGPDIAAFRDTGNSNDQGLIFSTYHNSNGTTDTLTLDSLGMVTASSDMRITGHLNLSGSVTASGTAAGSYKEYSPYAQGMVVERSTGGNKSIEYKNTNLSWYAGLTSTSNFVITQNGDIAASDADQFVISGSGQAGAISMGTRTPTDDVRLTVQSNKTYQQSIQYDASTRCLIGVAGTGLVTYKSDNTAGYLWTVGATTRFKASGSGDFHADGDVFAASTQVGSDIRLKKNVKDTPYGLSEVLQMRPVEFDWKEKRGGRHDIGVIAQEIEPIIPEIVRNTKDVKDNTSYKTVDYGKLSSVLIKAIQEQDKKIDKLQEEVNELRRNE